MGILRSIFKPVILSTCILVFLLIGLVSQGKESNVMNASNVTHSATAQVQNNELFIHYEVKNRTDKPIYLVNRVFQWTASGRSIDSNLVYTELIDKHLRVTKACIEIPEQIDVEAPIVPFLTQVDAQSNFEESFVLSLPIVSYHPYIMVAPTLNPYTFDGLELVIGWLSSEGLSVHRSKDSGSETLLSAKYTDVSKGQHLLKTSFDLKVSAYIKPQ